MNVLTWIAVAVLVVGSALVAVLYLREVYLYARKPSRHSEAHD